MAKDPLEAVTKRWSVEKGVLKNFIKKETLAQVFSCQFCEISKNTFFTEHLWMTAFDLREMKLSLEEQMEF